MKPITENGEFFSDSEMKISICICPSVMLLGNYACRLIDPQTEPFILNCIGKEDRKEVLQKVLEQFIVMQKIYHVKHPLTDYPDDTKSYKQSLCKFGNHLLEHFAYCNWPNYLQRVIEHVYEIIEKEGSVGIFSSEGNEAGNKLFRHIRQHHSCKNTVQGSLEDTLKMHMLYSSKTL